MTLTVEPNRVVITEAEDDDGLQAAVVHGVVWRDTPGKEEFESQFEIVGDFRTSDDGYDHGFEKITVIQRNSDGAKFGYIWWWSPNDDSEVDPNGEDHGFVFGNVVEGDWSTYTVTYVWLPVVDDLIPTYKLAS